MSTNVSGGARVKAADLEAFCLEAMRKAGIRDEDARLAAEVLVTTDTWGTHTHGTRQLRGLLRCIREGRLDAAARSEVVSQGPCWAIVDGHFALPPATSYRAMQMAVAKARETGMGYVGVRHSSHFGAAGFYANLAARDGMLGMSMCNVDPCMTVPGGKGKIIGTNPIAYAVPCGDGRTVYLDIATSAVAATKIFNAKSQGERIPDTWLVDDEGVPTTDPGIFPEHGAQLPMAGHKGYGLAVLVEIMSAAMTGASILSKVVGWSGDAKEKTDQGHAFIAMNVEAMAGSGFSGRLRGLVDEIHAAPKARGTERIYLPGEIEWDKRADSLKNGMALPPYVKDSLRGLVADYGLDPVKYNLDLSK
jgi:ureidoglycolate dehydrogenase (NAD+)